MAQLSDAVADYQQLQADMEQAEERNHAIQLLQRDKLLQCCCAVRMHGWLRTELRLQPPDTCCRCG
ncbi:hypothetical protein HaLaN_23478 [Haematococcus lacustris]|uniref:Uncharacterized protein n=1 Tax=Haematococcus lacustris TaxID=44745 RepID=A0A699ZWD6_HAELA|nr:hypothetical protein HaLaN_23478 [Haematococcus lacustris]